MLDHLGLGEVGIDVQYGLVVLDGPRHVALGEIRIEVFRGKSFFKLWHQVTFTGSPWRDRLAGHGLTLRVALPDPPDGAFDTTFRLVRRPEVLAPAAADAALQRSAYDTPLVVPARSGR